ncbi:NAD(P)/FAD-dependent oxidoreductase [soil metagenome]
MIKIQQYDVIIIGGSYSGLAAGMALGRAFRSVLVIDNNKPCNEQTPFSHNFITQDGKTPKEISTLAKEQVKKYDTVKFVNDLALKITKHEIGFEIFTQTERIFYAKKLIFATGIKDIMPNIKGYAECWGISVLHCPYCHGYELKDKPTGVLGNGDFGFEFSMLISNWTKDLTLFTNGQSTLTREQTSRLESHQINIIEQEIAQFDHKDGQLRNINFKDGTIKPLEAIYARSQFVQHCNSPQLLGCEITSEGYIKVDPFQKTTIPGVFACGDNTSKIRTVANAVAQGTTTGMMVNKEIIIESF